MVLQAVFDKERFRQERGYYCECGCGQEGHDAHHALIHNIKEKGKTKYEELNDERNLILVNHFEHINRKFDTLEWRRYFWKKQIERYGPTVMMEWLDSLPIKLRYRLDFIERN